MLLTENFFNNLNFKKMFILALQIGVINFTARIPIKEIFILPGTCSLPSLRADCPREGAAWICMWLGIEFKVFHLNIRKFFIGQVLILYLIFTLNSDSAR